MAPIHTSRCKFICNSVRKFRNLSSNPSDPKFMYEYDFQVVYSGSEENKKFFASTPNGKLSLSVVRDDLFEPGKEYYLDLTMAIPESERDQPILA